MALPVKLGVSSAISTKLPSEDDKVASESMLAFLGEMGALEDEACLEVHTLPARTTQCSRLHRDPVAASP